MNADGALMLEEIREQPAAVRRLAGGDGAIREAAARLGAARPMGIRLVGHGTSDNAATYGVYALGVLAGWTAFRDSISLTVYYDAPVNFDETAVIAVSQSGETPDVVAYAARARERGALTVALTNDPRSALARTADLVVELCAGPEQAVAATKTYATSLAVFALLAAHIAGRGSEMASALQATADLLDEAIASLEPRVVPLAEDLAFVRRMFVIGRGIELATAREIALKLQETARVAADALSATAMVHGPVAAVDPMFPVWTIATDPTTRAAVRDAARRAREIGAILVAAGPADAWIEGTRFHLATPAAPEPLLAPLLSIVPGQLFARALALAKGFNPDAPVGLVKVTLPP